MATTGTTLPASRHRILIDAFHSIQDKNALGWVALDTKFERFALAAIATEIKRQEGRVAHVEFPPRMDLVILDTRLPSQDHRCLDTQCGRVKMRYEAKAGQLFDFAPQQRTKQPYLGGLLNDDLAKLNPETGAGLFFISDADDPCRYLKYYAGHKGVLGDAIRELQRNVTNGALVATEVIDCGVVDGSALRIHMCVFDRK
jgi:hypothetical protein